MKKTVQKMQSKTGKEKTEHKEAEKQSEQPDTFASSKKKNAGKKTVLWIVILIELFLAGYMLIHAKGNNLTGMLWLSGNVFYAAASALFTFLSLSLIARGTKICNPKNSRWMNAGLLLCAAGLLIPYSAKYPWISQLHVLCCCLGVVIWLAGFAKEIFWFGYSSLSLAVRLSLLFDGTAFVFYCLQGSITLAVEVFFLLSQSILLSLPAKKRS
jgi:hypothetical protein